MCQKCKIKKQYSKELFQIFFAFLFFVSGFFCKPLFYVSYLIISYDVILKSLKNVFKKDFFDENLLMTLATFGALYLDEPKEAVMVIFLYKIGEFLEDKIVDKTKESVEKLADLKPESANLIINNEIKKVPVETLKINDIIIVKPGEKVPTDGVIVEGKSNVNCSIVNGENLAKFLKKGDEISAGIINLDAVLKIKVLKEYNDSTIAKIIKLTDDASKLKSKEEKFITKFAKIYTPFVVFLAIVIAFVLPLFFDGNWLYRSLTFLIISCPCALLISVPLSFYRGIALASQNGILIKGGNYINLISKIQNVVFDKTGTLTTSDLKVEKVVSKNPEFLKLIASIEAFSNHPIAKAIKKEYKGKIENDFLIEEIPAMGLVARRGDETIKIGKAQFINTKPADEDGIIVYCSINDVFEGYVVIKDEIKKNAKTLVEFLKKNKIKTMILSGDKKQNVEDVQLKLGIDEIYWDLLPDEKLKILEQNLNKITMYTGDGINDAPCVSRAHIGVSMGEVGQDITLNISDVVILDDDIGKIITLIKISKNTIKKVWQNIALILSVKILFLILGSFGLVGIFGAIFADVGLTLIAIFNSVLINKR